MENNVRYAYMYNVEDRQCWIWLLMCILCEIDT